MHTYLLDTNIVSYLADPSSAFHEHVVDAIQSLPDESRLAISLLTLYELARHNVDLILASTAIVEGAVILSNDGIFKTLAELEPQLAVENWAVSV